MNMTRRAGAEFFGTFWLTFGGCGSAVLAAAFPALGIGFLGVALGLRPDGADDGLRGRSHLGRSFQSRGHARTVGRQTMPDRRRDPVHRRAGGRRHHSRRPCSI